MLLPNAERAIIDPPKLHGYVLSASHPVGRFKARFFAALQPFTIRAILNGPASSALVTSVWFLRAGEEAARFVTAYPGGKA